MWYRRAAVLAMATVLIHGLPATAVAQTTLLDPVDEAAPPFASPLAVLLIAALALGTMALLRRKMRQEALRADHFTTRTALLEATLDGADLAVAGWPASGRGAPVATPGFLTLFDLEELIDLTPLLDRLTPEDAVALESDFEALHRDGEPFARDVSTRTGDRLAVAGRRGAAVAATVEYDVLTVRRLTPSSGPAEQPQVAPTVDDAGVEAGLRAVVDALPMPAWVRDPAGRLAHVNAAYAAAVELPPAQAVAENAALSGAAAPVGEGEDVPVVVAGERRHMRLFEVSLPGGGADHPGAEGPLLGIALDRSDVADLRGNLRRQARAQQEILGTLRTAVAVWGPDRRLTFCNTAYETLWQLEGAWLATGPTMQEVHEELRRRRRLPEVPDQRQERARVNALFTDTLEPQESALHLPDGTALRMVIAPHPLGGLIELADDETEALQIERDLNTLMAVQAASLQNLVEAVLVTGENGRVRFHNAAFAELWDMDPAYLGTGPHLSTLIPPLVEHVPEASRRPLEETLRAAGFEREGGAYQIDRRDGRVIDYSTAPLPDGSVMHRFLDITDSKEVERALIAANEALGAADRLKSEFVANVSYQLRTPLNAIKGYAEMLSQGLFGPLSDRQRESSLSILRSAGELQALTDAVLDLASIDAGLLEIEAAPVSVDALLQQVVAVGQDWVRSRKLELDLFLPGAIGEAMLDEARVKQVLYNLLSNAARFNHPGGRIAITARREDGMIVFVVSDTGSGIGEDDRDRLFNPFVSEGRGRGVGLGLSLVDRLVALHGGSVRLEPNVPTGTRVIVALPADGPPPPMATDGGSNPLALDRGDDGNDNPADDSPLGSSPSFSPGSPR